MADERRKGPPDRRRSRAAKAPQDETQARTSSTDTPDVQAPEAARARHPNEAQTQADALDESLRALQREERGEVF